jgi:hypothetical protein
MATQGTAAAAATAVGAGLQELGLRVTLSVVTPSLVAALSGTWRDEMVHTGMDAGLYVPSCLQKGWGRMSLMPFIVVVGGKQKEGGRFATNGVLISY